jgi:hypothetical protein
MQKGLAKQTARPFLLHITQIMRSQKLVPEENFFQPKKVSWFQPQVF